MLLKFAAFSYKTIYEVNLEILPLATNISGEFAFSLMTDSSVIGFI